MFFKNDKALLTTRIIIIVVLIVLAVLSVVAGVVLAIVGESPLYLLVGVGGLFLCWLLWVMATLYMSYLCDIKLIRNKLYDVSNENLNVFLVAKSRLQSGVVCTTSREPLNNNGISTLENLKSLYDSGAISEQEYEAEKRKILNGGL